MIPTYTCAEMRAYEQQAVARGIGYLKLMENAGQGAAADLLKRFPTPDKALIVCGKGNNGGDGLVIARVLAQHHWTIDIAFVLGDKLSELAQANLNRLQPLTNVSILPQPLPTHLTASHYTLIIDGIFGTGFSGTLPENIATVCRALNQTDSTRVALDIPTGLNGDTAEADTDTFQAQLTYTFAAFKPAHHTENGKKYCGETICIPIV